MNQNEFIAALKKLNACSDSLRWVENTPGTPEELYQTCERPDWLEFLFQASQEFLFQGSKVELAWTEYCRQADQLLAECDRQVKRLWAECCRQTKLGGERDHQIEAEFYRQADQLWAKYKRQCCTVLRTLLPWSQVEAGLGKR